MLVNFAIHGQFPCWKFIIASEQIIERFYTVSVAKQDSTGKLHEHKGIFSTNLGKFE